MLVKVRNNHSIGDVEAEPEGEDPQQRQRRQDSRHYDHAEKSCWAVGQRLGVDAAHVYEGKTVEPVKGDDKVVADCAKVQCVAQEQRQERVVDGDERQQDEAHQIQKTPYDQERVAVNVEAEAPLDVVNVVAHRGEAERLVEEAVGHQPRHGGYHDAGQIKVYYHGIQDQFDYVERVRRVRQPPRYGADHKKRCEQDKERRVVSGVRVFAGVAMALVVVARPVHFAGIDDQVENLPHGGLEVQCHWLEEASEHLLEAFGGASGRKWVIVGAVGAAESGRRRPRAIMQRPFAGDGPAGEKVARGVRQIEPCGHDK